MKSGIRSSNAIAKMKFTKCEMGTISSEISNENVNVHRQEKNQSFGLPYNNRKIIGNVKLMARIY